MERLSDEQLESCIRWTDGIELSFVELQFIHLALTELRERRSAEKASVDDDEMLKEWYKRS